VRKSRSDVAHVDEAERASSGDARANEEERGAEIGKIREFAVRATDFGL